MTRPADGGAGTERRCRRCGAAIATGRHPGGTATVGAVTAGLPPRPVERCRRGHGTEHAAVRIALARLPRARWRPRGPARCGACRAVLELPARRTTRSVTVETPGHAPVTLELALPLVRCPDCAVDNVPVDVRPSLRAAVRAALR